ncbi:MAG: tetratricopeptide repeat protein [Cyanobacteria bacterium SZAS LIN-2]|nr:tetratricopeptide repeat protein [Cyanobacteria bacterium SZAS LIN-2]
MAACSLTAVTLLVIPPCAGAQKISGSTVSDESTRLYQQGVELTQKGQIDAAIASFEQGLKAAPRNKLLLNAEGAAYSMKGEMIAARNLFLKSLDSDSGFVGARRNLGIAYFSLGDYQAAELQFKIIEGQSGSNEGDRLFLGMIAEKRSDWSTGAELLKKAGSILDQYPEAVLAYAECEYQLDNYASSAQILAALDKIPNASSDQLKAAADLKSRIGQHIRVRAEPAKASTGRELVGGADLKKTIKLESPDRLDEAQHKLEAAMMSAPTADGLMDLAKVAKKRGDIALALKSLKHASELAPELEDAYLEFSSICSDHGSDALALEAAETGLEHLPNSYGLMVQKGVVLEKLGHLTDAETVLRSATTMAGDTSIARLSLAIVLAHEEKIAEAEETLADAIRSYPENYYMHYFRGKLLLQFSANAADSEEMNHQAQQSLERSIELNREYADSYYQLSKTYEQSSPARTESALSKCLKLDPHHIPAQYALARLYVRTGRKAAGQEMIARLKTQQRTEEIRQQKQLLIEVAQD